MKRNKQFYQEKEYRRFLKNESWHAIERYSYETEEYETEEYVVVPNYEIIPSENHKKYEEVCKYIKFIPFKNISKNSYESYLRNKRYRYKDYFYREELEEINPNNTEIFKFHLKDLETIGYSNYIDNTYHLKKELNNWDEFISLIIEKDYYNHPREKFSLKNPFFYRVEKQIIKHTNKYDTGQKPGLLCNRMGGDYGWHKYFKQSNKYYGRDIDWCWTYSKHQPDFKSKKHNKNADNKWLRTDVDWDDWDKNEPYWREWEEEYINQNDRLYDDWLEYKHEQDNIHFDDAICKWGFIY